MRLYMAESGHLFSRVHRMHEAATGENIFNGKNILQSFWYCNNFTEEKIIPHCKSFLLDSGAFTLMRNAGKSVSWLEYLDRYIQFINKNKVELFFELDIDSVVGHDKVLELRKRLEAGTGRKCIPVWHKSRGREEWLRLCEEYDYVAIGGIATAEISRKEHRFFPWFIEESHKRRRKDTRAGIYAPIRAVEIPFRLCGFLLLVIREPFRAMLHLRRPRVASAKEARREKDKKSRRACIPQFQRVGKVSAIC